MTFSKLKTPEGVPVVVGQKWKCLDPRRPRVCEVIALDEPRKRVRMWRDATLIKPFRRNWVAVRNMKRSHTGWELMP
jgi:hypothetical protein